MTAPVPSTFVKLGPGELQIGAVGSEIDISCNVQQAKVTASKNAGTTVHYLCGSSSPGAITYEFTLEGQFDIDIADGAASLFAFCWDNAGEEAHFTFTPNTDDGSTVDGTLIVDPLELGADEYGANLTSPFSFSIVSKPTITYAPVVP